MINLLDVRLMREYINKLNSENIYDEIYFYINMDNALSLLNNIVPKLYDNVPLIRTKMINIHKTYSIEALNNKFTNSINDFINYVKSNNSHNVRYIYIVTDNEQFYKNYNCTNVVFLKLNEFNEHLKKSFDNKIGIIVVDTKINDFTNSNVHYSIIKCL